MSRRRNDVQGNLSIEHIKVENFRSFKYLDISLDKFNLLIGANASGKSNFAQIFQFLNDITLDGLDSAVSQQGGMEYLLNFTDSSTPLSYEITFNAQATDLFFISNIMRGNAHITKAVYRFEIQPRPDSNIKIANDEWKISVDISNDKKEKIPLEVVITNKNSKPKIDIVSLQNNQLKDEINKIKDYAEHLFAGMAPLPHSLLLESPFITGFILRGIGNFCSEVEVYDFDPKLAKRPVQIRGPSELDPDGANLAVAMKNVMQNPRNQKTFFNLIADVLPFVYSVDTKMLLDSSVILMQKENYFKDKSIPATLISDGTINITALICALYFQNNPLIIIEEPERNIHPALIAKIVDMMEDASNQKQIIATTHSAEMVRYVNIENILLIKRDETGNSQIIKPSNQEDVKEFLENDMDIRELYVQNMLGD